jgi:hypothetical protein
LQPDDTSHEERQMPELLKSEDSPPTTFDRHRMTVSYIPPGPDADFGFRGVPMMVGAVKLTA